MSFLTRTIHEAEHLTLNDPMLGDYSTVKKNASKSQVEYDYPWVEKLAVSAMADTEYMVMVSHIELGTEVFEISKECELSKLSSSYKDLSTLTLKGEKHSFLKIIPR